MSNSLDERPILSGLANGNDVDSSFVGFSDEAMSTSILRATVLLEDATNFRSIFHKADKLPLLVYRCYYSRAVQNVLYTNIFVILILAFFEAPSSLSLSSDITMPSYYLTKYEFTCGILETIDMFCLILFAVDCFVKSYLIGKRRILKSPWVIAYYVVLLISFVDLIVSFSTICQETVRIRRYLRPFFLMQCSSLMKKTIKSLRRTLPQIISVFVLITIHLYFFTMIGMLIFPRYYQVNNKNSNSTLNLNGGEYVQLPDDDSTNMTNYKIFVKNKIFTSIKNSLLNMLILLTASNNPDVMLQAYAQNRLASIYFVSYLIIGLFCLMSMVTAVIYNQFKGFFQDSMISSAFRQSIGIRAAFWVLYDRFHDDEKLGYLPKEVVSCTIQNLSISKDRRSVLLRSLDELNYGIQEETDIDPRIDLEQFEKLFLDNLNADLEKSNLDELVSSNAFDQPSRLAMIRRHLRTAFESKYSMTISCLMTIINIGCISAELHLVDDLYVPKINHVLSYIILAFSIYYMIENCLKIWALRWQRYIRNYLMFVDGIISFVFFVLQVVHLGIYHRPFLTFDEMSSYERTTSIWGISRVVNMFLIFRLIHLAPSVKVMYAILSTCIDILRSLRPLFGILVVNYYVFALIGMQIFSNKIQTDSFDRFNRSGNDFCGTYKQLNYWSLNFNDFYSSLIVLWNLMVVNNWQVTVQAFVDVTNEWSVLYFVTWWVICPVITLNMCVSLILDLFVLKWEKTLQSNAQTLLTGRAPLIKSMHGLFDDVKWKADGNRLNSELAKHAYIDFSRMIKNLDGTDDFSTILNQTV